MAITIEVNGSNVEVYSDGYNVPNLPILAVFPIGNIPFADLNNNQTTNTIEIQLKSKHLIKINTNSIPVVSVRIVCVSDALLLREVAVFCGPTHLHDSLTVEHNLIHPFALKSLNN